MFKTIYICILLMFSAFSHAALYTYDATDKQHILGVVTQPPGFMYAYKTWVNKVKEQWQPNDVLRISQHITQNGKEITIYGYGLYTANGNFVLIPEVQVATISGTNVEVTLRAIDPIVWTGDGGGIFPSEDSEEFNNSDDLVYRDPLIIDLGQDGIHMRSDRAIVFDYLGNGEHFLTQWVAPNGNEAFVFIDLNENGTVDNGTELFGDTMVLLEGNGKEVAKDGFEALTQYNQSVLGGNNDDNISADDLIWPQLKLWLDIDANGISTPDEIMTLDEANISTISLQTKESNRQDANGNRLPLWSWATNQNEQGNKKHKVIDVFFKALPANSVLIDTQP